MVDVLNDRQKVGPHAIARARRRRVALILILIVDVGYIAWGAGAAFARSPARSRWQSDPAGGLRGLLRRVVVGAGRDLPANRGIHDSALPDVRHLQRPVRTHGQRHRCHRLPPWRAVGMVGVARRQHGRLVSAISVRQDRKRYRAVRADGIPWPRPRLGSARRHSSIR